jgi:beta-aspartyl-peptidase (threonine type)
MPIISKSNPNCLNSTQHNIFKKNRKNMKFHFFLSFLVLVIFSSCTELTNSEATAEASVQNQSEPPAYTIAIHGGAGTILKETMSDEKETAYLAKLNEALDTGEEILKNGGTAMDAVEATIMIMEDSPLFNAGKGAVFTNDGTNELDASFMDGKTQNAGAIGGVKTVKNPIKAARAVMDNSPHVMLSGSGADQFAKEQGLEIVDPSYFHTDRRWESLQDAKKRENKQTGYLTQVSDYKYGTVGCAALDKDGNLAAGTSTGGMTNKRWGRIGDAPIIAAGVYADNATCAVSSTGHGEYFIRYVVAYDIAARMAYLGESLEEASNHVVNKKLVEKGGSGGIISVDKDGNVAMPFNSKGMYRGYAKPNERVVKIYED